MVTAVKTIAQGTSQVMIISCLLLHATVICPQLASKRLFWELAKRLTSARCAKGHSLRTGC